MVTDFPPDSTSNLLAALSIAKGNSISLNIRISLNVGLGFDIHTFLQI